MTRDDGQSLDRFRDLVGGDLGVERTDHKTGIDQAAAAMGYDLRTWVGRQQRELDVLALRWDASARAGAIALSALRRDWHAKAQQLEQELERVYGSSVDRDAVRAWLADRRTQIEARRPDEDEAGLVSLRTHFEQPLEFERKEDGHG